MGPHTLNITQYGELPGKQVTIHFIEWTNTTKEPSHLDTSTDNECILFHFVFYTIFVGLPCLLGVAGNTLSLIVLQRDRGNAAASFLLQALAIADNAVLLISFVTLSIVYGLLPLYYADLVNQTKAYVIAYVHPFGYMTQSATVWCTVLLAINQYLAVCCPLQSLTLCTIKQARIQVGCAVCFSVIFNCPRFFQWRVDITPLNHYPTLTETTIGEKSLFGIIYTNALYTFLVLILPLGLLLALNYNLVVQLRKMAYQRSNLAATSIQPQEENITMVTAMIIVIFILCNVPDRVLVVARLFAKYPGDECGQSLIYAFAICNFLLIINSSTNFLVYYFFRKHFRSNLADLLCSTKTEKKPGLDSGEEINHVSLLPMQHNIANKRVSYSSMSVASSAS